ncbi:excinuclease ABC subunit UvrC [Parenemella sanctibonifatiensis]|uniref:UvrABC system protein C n=1 Tax=Parenemella sanctibonifatiensis TaxID=2016505 RepID=A0A255EFE4_9ACTN|nr:excinuclease ABC subunit UvrC [Parenemella sanctibonifatiensis]OYN88305.1 excinuclease ABC subunit C [Parenemella sanctibonifatiensis]
MADPATYRPAPGAIPTEPGVYRFIDGTGQVIYVGKAKNLRQRLNSYFGDPAGLHPRTQTMVRTAERVEWTVVATEVESLQLEYTWIQQYDPRFNVKYRDDKSYPWLAITWSEEFPRIFVGRGAKRKGTRYFGPYGQAWAIRETVDLLLRVFPMRSCSKGVFNNAKAAGRPCLLGYIDKCSAPCVGRVSPEQHREIAADMVAFLSGRSKAMIGRLEREMARAAEAMEYERAGVLRDDLAALRKATEKNAIVLPDGTDADVVALADDPLEVGVQIFHVRGGRVRGERGWVADRVDDADTSSLMESFLLQLYAETDATDGPTVPREVLVSHAPASGEDAMAELLTELRGSAVTVRVPQRGDKRILLETVTRNARETLSKHKVKRAADLTTRNRALEEIATALDLDEPPLRIECYDISHTQGQEIVGSMVVFEDGLPRKSEYRRFIIRSTDHSDDVKSMHEVITRRFRRMLAEQDSAAQARDDGSSDAPQLRDPDTGAPKKFAYAPGLVVVDGGQPQVAAAQQAMAELGIDIPLCGLAKRLEEVWVPDDDHPVILPRTSEGLYLLQRLRDEAHRFAITHHRGRRTKAMVESVLDSVPGLGEVRRTTLMRRYGSVRKLRAATATEIAELPGFGPATAQAVVDALRDQPAGEAVNMATGEVLD